MPKKSDTFKRGTMVYISVDIVKELKQKDVNISNLVDELLTDYLLKLKGNQPTTQQSAELSNNLRNSKLSPIEREVRNKANQLTSKEFGGYSINNENWDAYMKRYLQIYNSLKKGEPIAPSQ